MFRSDGIHLIGILNMSPDSFSDGRNKSIEEGVVQAKLMINAGATIIDIGAESTRPGAEAISVDEELSRLEGIVVELKKEKVCVSVDTYKYEITQRMLELGVDIINDVSGLLYDEKKIHLIKKYEASIIIMHNRLNEHGLPHVTKKRYQYSDVVGSVIKELQKQVDVAKKAGLSDSQIAIDPGFGFAKTYEENIELFRGLDKISAAFSNHEMVLGTSNKSFIGQMTGAEVDKRLAGTLATSIYGVNQGYRYLRIHDVQAHADFFNVYHTIGGK